MRRAARWTVTLVAGGVVFGVAWWLSERLSQPRDVALSIAGVAAALVLAPLAWWAGRETRHQPRDGGAAVHGEHGQAIETMTGGAVFGAGSTVTFVNGSGSPQEQTAPASPRPRNRPEVYLDELPSAAMRKIVGRDRELALLRHLWADKDASVVSVVGFGGIGKTALVDTFLNELAPEYDGADRVFAWHFYSQEEHGSATSSSSLFWDRALRFFGYAGALPAHETEKAHQLCRTLQGQKLILVLDGVESLQNPPDVNDGLLHDEALQRFLTSVARDGLGGGGLVIVTSRQPVVELRRFDRAAVLNVGALKEEVGAGLLRQLGVRGSEPELRAAVSDYRGHPLSLVLLAKILVSDYHGDVLQRFNVDPRGADVVGNVGAILDYYTRALSGDDPELTYLFLVALFRRPVREAELDELIAKSSVAASLRVLPAPRRARAVSHLRDRGLLITEADYYDTHALIRRYFASQFAERHPVDFRQANKVLFEYFAAVPEAELPATMDDLEPLYRAIPHGCLAGRHSDALDIYWRRICRERSFFSQKRLGAFSADLAAIASFFPDNWDHPVDDGDLSAEQRAFLLALASFLLTALGRLTEAGKPRVTEIDAFEALGDWRMVCGDARNLVQILLPLGRLPDALRASERAVAAAARITDDTPRGTYSAHMDDTYLRVSATVRKAAVLHRLGRLDAAGELFDQAEQQYGRPLDRVNFYYQGLFLLDSADGPDRVRKVIRQGEENLRAARKRANAGDMGQSHLVIGAALLRLQDLQLAQDQLDEAVVRLRSGSRLDRLPMALLMRARLERARWLATGRDLHIRRCQADLAEAEEIISFSRMALYQVELNLLRCWLLADNGEIADAQELIRTSITPLIAATGYRLRLAEARELTARVDGEG